MGRHPASFELAGLPHRTAPDEQAIALPGRFPLRAQPDDRRAIEPALQKIRQVDIRKIDVPADQALLELPAGRIGYLDDRHLDPGRLYQSGAERVVDSKHREAITIVGQAQFHELPTTSHSAMGGCGSRSQYARSPATTWRRSRRRSLSLKSVRACKVQRLSHRTRSPTRHLCA